MTDMTTYATGDHQVAGDGPPPPPPPLTPVPPTRRRTAGEEARTLVAQTNVATLATLSRRRRAVGLAGQLRGAGRRLAGAVRLHARRARAQPRPRPARQPRRRRAAERRNDPLAAGRVTLAGRVARPSGDDASASRRAAYLASGPDRRDVRRASATSRSTCCGSSACAGSAATAGWTPPTPTPTPPPRPTRSARRRAAVTHLNEDHADALLIMAQALGGYPDAETARCTAADRYGLDLMVGTPRGSAPARVGFAEPVTEPAGLRGATVELTRRARATAPPSNPPPQRLRCAAGGGPVCRDQCRGRQAHPSRCLSPRTSPRCRRRTSRRSACA